jgi:hypothetical protein
MHRVIEENEELRGVITDGNNLELEEVPPGIM